MGGEPVDGLADRVALVTGAASGLGRAIALVLGARGTRVVVADLPAKAEAAAGVAQEIEAAAGVPEGTRATVAGIDVRDPETLTAAVAHAVEVFGRLDIAVCSAGINIRRPALEVTPEDWEAVVDINLRGVFFSAQAAARQMVRQGGGGKIVSIASIFGLVGGTDRAPYAASKGGVVNLTRALAVEWAPHRIQVNAVAPTFVLTPLTESIFQDQAYLAWVLDRTPNGQLATTLSVAEAVAFLASPQADGITGVTLPVDGGWTAQ